MLYITYLLTCVYETWQMILCASEKHILEKFAKEAGLMDGSIFILIEKECCLSIFLIIGGHYEM